MIGKHHRYEKYEINVGAFIDAFCASPILDKADIGTNTGWDMSLILKM